jgi:hypothetical protein
MANIRAPDYFRIMITISKALLGSFNEMIAHWIHIMPGSPVTMAIMAVVLLSVFLIGKIQQIVADMFYGCIDSSDDRPWDDATQINKAGRLFRSRKYRRSWRLCNRIIASNSCFAPTAATLVYWIENPVRLKFFNPSRTTIILKGKYSI